MAVPDEPGGEGQHGGLRHLQSYLNNQSLLDEYTNQERSKRYLLRSLRSRLSLIGDPVKRRASVLSFLVDHPMLLDDCFRLLKAQRGRQQPEEWYDTITTAERINLIELLVDGSGAVRKYPSDMLPTEQWYNNCTREVLRQKISCRLDEEEVFETARSRTEYYHRLAEKLWKTEMELEEQWNATRRSYAHFAAAGRIIVDRGRGPREADDDGEYGVPGDMLV